MLSVFDSINDAYYTSGHNKAEPVYKAYYDIIKRFREDHAFFREWETMIDNLNQGVISQFKAELPSVTKSQSLFFTLAVSNFSYSTISVIMDTSKSVLYNRRRRLINTIQNSDAAHKDLFLSYLPNKNPNM